MDYSSVRQSSSHGSAVSVNHRALITRALTKYPVDHALFRELLQNSADARANSATIQFSTPSTDMNPLEIHNIPINRLTFKNDGMDFNDDDWKRLKEIASGNPNESKIGAFGVGFYSVFELTDEPLVHSGNRIVNFKYKGVQLHHFDSHAPEYQKGTLIDLPYKHIGKLGDIGDFIGFLIQNFLLVNLNEINFEIIYGNGTKKSVLHLTKTQGSTLPMNTPSAFKCARSLFFTLKEVKMTNFTVGCKYMNAAFLPPLSMNKGIFALGKQLFSSLTETPKDPEGITEFSCELSRVDASISVSLDRKFKEKITESLLKPPPRATTISMLSISDASGASSLNSKLRHYVFPEDVNDAKIFIGFSTKQSTGFRSHLALQSAIPTMERTALDIAHSYVKEWNLELLRMAGAVARFAYENELMRCKFLDLADQAKCVEQAKMVCSGFKFQSSAPDKTIGEYVKNGFYSSSSQTLVPSTQGVLPSTEVKYTDEKMVKLLKKTPVIDDIELADYLRKFVTIGKVTPSDIVADVCSSPLDLQRAKLYIDWLKNHWHEFTSDEKRKLTKFTIDIDSKLIDLGSATSYHDLSILNIAAISNNLPKNCIPATIAQEIGQQNLRAIFGLHPLQAFPCIEMRVDELIRISRANKPSTDLERLAYEILEISSLCWPQLNPETQVHLVELLSTVKCIPTTNMGLQYPKDTYIEPIRGFNNVPVATKKFSPDWLESIGVRKSLNMRVVLDKLMNDELSWSNEDLIGYLHTNQKNLKKSDWHVLKESFFFRSSDFEGLFKASNLYAPDPTLTKLRIPTLKHDEWNAYSSEAKLMFALGLKRFPSASLLLSQGVSTKQPTIAIDYFVRHFREAKYSTHEIKNIQFLPTTTPQILASPANCYTDNEVSIFGELVLSPQYETVANTLGVARSPPASKFLYQVITDPAKYLSSSKTREDVFSFFAKKVHELNRGDIELCKRRRFIPAVNPYTNKNTWYRPNEVFLPYRGDDPEIDVLRPILPTYRGSSRSLTFFHFLNVSEFPNAHQLATHIVQNPLAAFEKLNNKEVYEQALSLIGKKWDSSIAYDNDLVAKMFETAFLLGEKSNEKSGEKTTSLYHRSQLAIVNDSIIFNQFKNVVVTAPQDASVEVIYRRLKVPTLSSLLKERYYVESEIDDPEGRNALKERIQERLKLFMEYTKSPLLTKNTNLRIKLVRGIRVERQLPPHRAISLSTTCHWNAKGDELLIVPKNIDWLDVANALCKKFIERPNQDTVVVLELQLSASLSDLERKGYNIERLRRKAPSKISLENLMNRSKEQSKSLQKPEAPHQKGPSQQTPPQLPLQPPTKLPAQSPLPPQPPQQLAQQEANQQAQPDKNDRSALQQQDENTPAELPGPSKFIPNWINKMLSGSEGSSAGAQNNEQSAAGNLRPDANNRGFGDISGGAVAANGVGRRPTGTNVGQPQQDVPQEQKIRNFDNTLGSGRSKVRQYNGNTLNGNDNVDIPADLAPQPTESCGVGNRHDISLTRTLENGVKVFQDGANTQPRQDELVLSEMLLWLSRVYNIAPECISIFREQSSTVAFNQNGSLFFNSYHLPDTPNALDYWYTIMAHELAHNLCGPHNSTHSFFTEGYIRSTLRQYLSANGH